MNRLILAVALLSSVAFAGGPELRALELDSRLDRIEQLMSNPRTVELARADLRRLRLELRDEGQRPPRHGWRRGMSEGAFSTLLRQVADAYYDSKRVALLEDLRPALTSEQVARVLRELDYDSTRVKAVKVLAATLIDPEQRFVFYSAFDYPSSREAVAKFFRGES